RRLRRLGGSALGLVLALGVGLGVANRYVPVRYLLADAYSATGEQRELTLPDATHVRLNSRSAIDVRFDGERRQVVLLAGEILEETAHGDPRP
ncbi:amino acid ABC transporter substrate-binding protein, partial [Xanthomonas citri pv. citri]|nr:amino acid ABC transporter substrate-binding protein [Xanthomonas citri pv. citri]